MEKFLKFRTISNAKLFTIAISFYSETRTLGPFDNPSALLGKYLAVLTEIVI